MGRLHKVEDFENAIKFFTRLAIIPVLPVYKETKKFQISAWVRADEDAAWEHHEMIVDGNITIAIIDGEMVDPSDLDIYVSSSGPNPIGYTGMIRDIQIYEGEPVEEDGQGNLVNRAGNLVGHYPLNEATGLLDRHLPRYPIPRRTSSND